jgi:hypothetical protein
VIYDKEVGDLYSSPNIRTIILRRVRWAGHVAPIKERRCFQWGNLKERDRYEGRRKREVNLEGIRWEVVEWMRLARNWDTWLALVGR